MSSFSSLARFSQWRQPFHHARQYVRKCRSCCEGRHWNCGSEVRWPSPWVRRSGTVSSLGCRSACCAVPGQSRAVALCTVKSWPSEQPSPAHCFPLSFYSLLSKMQFHSIKIKAELYLSYLWGATKWTHYVWMGLYFVSIRVLFNGKYTEIPLWRSLSPRLHCLQLFLSWTWPIRGMDKPI